LIIARKEDAEAHGKEWHRSIMQQCNQGVQEKQISRAGAKSIRKEGSPPIFLQEHILPMWKQWNGVSFEAIQGLYEHSIELSRTQMRSLRGGGEKELYGPRRQLTSREIENKMKAARGARRTHPIWKWTRLIEEVLTWRVADLIGQAVEQEMHDGNTITAKSHKPVHEKKKATLLKYMFALKSLIAPLKADDDVIQHLPRTLPVINGET
jgi:hypothetical protein